MTCLKEGKFSRPDCDCPCDQPKKDEGQLLQPIVDFPKIYYRWLQDTHYLRDQLSKKHPRLEPVTGTPRRGFLFSARMLKKARDIFLKRPGLSRKTFRASDQKPETFFLQSERLLTKGLRKPDFTINFACRIYRISFGIRHIRIMLPCPGLFKGIKINHLRLPAFETLLLLIQPGFPA